MDTRSIFLHLQPFKTIIVFWQTSWMFLGRATHRLWQEQVSGAHWLNRQTDRQQPPRWSSWSAAQQKHSSSSPEWASVQHKSRSEIRGQQTWLYKAAGNKTHLLHVKLVRDEENRSHSFSLTADSWFKGFCCYIHQ